MPDYTVQINFAALSDKLVRMLDPVIERTAFGLSAADGAAAHPLALPGFFKVDVAQARKRSFDVVKSESATWVLASGFREAIDGVHALLEETRIACAVVDLGASGDISVEQWNEHIGGKIKAFHKEFLRPKLEFLNTTYNVTVQPDRLQQLLSLNAARNCLVHRAGIVSPEHDANVPEGLRVSWRRPELRAVGPAGERSIDESNRLLDAGGTLQMSVSDTCKLFRAGEKVSFTAQEFSYVCLTLILFGQELAQNTVAYAKNRSFPFTPTQAAAGPGGGDPS